MTDVRGREVTFRADPLNEQVVIAAALCSGARAESFRKEAARRPPDFFLASEHPAVWQAIREAQNRGLPPDPATLVRLSGGRVQVEYLAELMAARPDLPAEETLREALTALDWDHQKHVAVTGPVDALVQALGKGEDPERVRALARQVAGCFEGWGDRRYLLDSKAVVRSAIADLRERMVGRAVYPYGIPGLDLYDPAAGKTSRRRLIPGAKPGLVTVVTALPGSGKSTLSARIVLGLLRQKRRVLFGAWEMTGNMTLELLACISLGWSRSDLMEGRFTNVELRKIEDRMNALTDAGVRFLENPFRRGHGGRPSNERNLDIVQGYLADAGCDVFVADLWKRCLVETGPAEEEEALNRQQAMANELGVHCILVQQQVLKEMEKRADKKPTREGIKGSGAWTEIADTILGVHRPALWKPMTDNVLEVDILKQRYGKWPLAVEFDWDPDRGMISGGRSVDYEMSTGGPTNALDAFITDPKKKPKR